MGNTWIGNGIRKACRYSPGGPFYLCICMHARACVYVGPLQHKDSRRSISSKAYLEDTLLVSSIYILAFEESMRFAIIYGTP